MFNPKTLDLLENADDLLNFNLDYDFKLPSTHSEIKTNNLETKNTSVPEKSKSTSASQNFVSILQKFDFKPKSEDIIETSLDSIVSDKDDKKSFSLSKAENKNNKFSKPNTNTPCTIPSRFEGKSESEIYKNDLKKTTPEKNVSNYKICLSSMFSSSCTNSKEEDAFFEDDDLSFDIGFDDPLMNDFDVNDKLQKLENNKNQDLPKPLTSNGTFPFVNSSKIKTKYIPPKNKESISSHEFNDFDSSFIKSTEELYKSPKRKGFSTKSSQLVESNKSNINEHSLITENFNSNSNSSMFQENSKSKISSNSLSSNKKFLFTKSSQANTKTTPNKNSQFLVNDEHNESSDYVSSNNDFRQSESDNFLSPPTNDYPFKSTESNNIYNSSNNVKCLQSNLKTTPSSHKNLSFHQNMSRKRKFPGPAGLLPDLPPNSPLLHDYSFLLDNAEDIYDQDLLCSQESLTDFSSEPWNNMLKDLGNCSSLLKDFNIKNVLKKAARRKLPKLVQMPFFCVLVKSLSCNKTDTKIVIKDETGEIPGRFEQEVLEKYSEILNAGSVLVLKKVAFLFNQLNIKLENIIRIYEHNGRSHSVSDWNYIKDFTWSSSPCNQSTSKEVVAAKQQNTSDNYIVNFEDDSLFEDDIDEIMGSIDESSFVSK